MKPREDEALVNALEDQ